MNFLLLIKFIRPSEKNKFFLVPWRPLSLWERVGVRVKKYLF
jgi:hypothetical protein